VFGRIIGGESVEIDHELGTSHFSQLVVTKQEEKTIKVMSIKDVQSRTHEDDCWTVINGKVYDLSRYASEHPGGEPAIRESCGKDSTKRFLSAHTEGLLADVGFEPIGQIDKYQPSV